jgi:molybdenum cofactor guanylyltransferase
MSEKIPVYGLVLAGGRSTRMGRDKASMLHPDGRTMVGRALDLLSAVCDEVAVSLRNDQELLQGLENRSALQVHRDEGNGPMEGILQAMRSAPEAVWLVVACDLPRLDETTLRHLVDSRLEGESYLSYRSEFDGLPEPLCALYAGDALAHLQQAMDAGMRCPRKILIRQQCRLLALPHPGALDNANTSAEWENAIRS